MRKNPIYPMRASVLCFAVSFFSLSAIPLAQLCPETVNKILGYVIAAVFWLFLFSGTVLFWLAKKRIRPYRRKLKSVGELSASRLPGVFRFSRRPLSLIMYGIILVGAVLIITDIIFSYVPSAVMFPILSVTLFAFALHCIVDSETYQVFLKYRKGMGAEL